MSVTIEEQRGRRAKLIEEMRDIQKGADATGRDLTAEEAQEFERREGEFDTLTADIGRREKLAGFAESVQGPNPAVEDVQPEARQVSSDPKEQAALELRAFEKVLRNKGHLGSLNKEERGALQVGDASEFGVTVPKAFHAQLVESMREFGVVGDLATHISTGDSGQLTIPKVTANTAASWTAEEAGYSESEPASGSITLDAYKLGFISKVSEELLHDSAFDVLGWIAQDSGKALGLKSNEAYAIGASGSTTTPEGLVTKASTGVTTAVNTGFTADELIDTYHSLLSPYRKNASWIMNDSTVKVARKFKDTTNQYLWQPGLAAGQPDTLLGRPVYTDPNVAAVAASARVAVFGDIAQAYIVRDVQDAQTQILTELYAANGQVGFRTFLRTDGDVRDTAAVKALVIKT